MSAPGLDVLYLPALELGARIRARKLSPVALTEAYLQRVDQLDPRLHAFATVTRDVALAQAREAEADIAKGKVRSPIHGVPYGAKDLLAVKGFPTTWGARPLVHQSFDLDAAVVRRLQEAGAVLLGKLAMVELAGGLGYSVASASATGAALNPWDTSRWTCGSSSGSGAAVSAALVGFAIGSETWGSILCPSAFTGISGFRPTFGRVSRAGVMALSWTMDKLGPMARTAEDCETILGLIAGHDPADRWSIDEPAPKPLPTTAAKTMKAAYVKMDVTKGDPDVSAAVDQAVDALRRAGVVVEETTLPKLPFEEIGSIVITAESATAFEELFRDGRVRQLVDVGAPVAHAAASAISAADYLKASRVRTLCMEAMAAFFSRFDVLLAPSEAMTALPADKSFADVSWPDPVGGMGNVCGLPAAGVPCGMAKGLPVGMQILAGAFEDSKAAAMARYFQTVTDWHTRKPPLA